MPGSEALLCPLSHLQQSHMGILICIVQEPVSMPYLTRLLLQDMFTSLTSATKPHHMVGGGQVILGYSHFGMLAAASWVFQETKAKLEEALQSQPSYRLQVVGHSLGGGTSALLTAR